MIAQTFLIIFLVCTCIYCNLVKIKTGSLEIGITTFYFHQKSGDKRISFLAFIFFKKDDGRSGCKQLEIKEECSTLIKIAWFNLVLVLSLIFGTICTLMTIIFFLNMFYRTYFRFTVSLFLHSKSFLELFCFHCIIYFLSCCSYMVVGKWNGSQ